MVSHGKAITSKVVAASGKTTVETLRSYADGDYFGDSIGNAIVPMNMKSYPGLARESVSPSGQVSGQIASTTR